jgi:hypothetical protein
MKNKKAWLRIVEAVLAILIILSTLLIITSKQTTKTDLSPEISEIQTDILNIINKNTTLRQYVIETPPNKQELTNTINQMLPNTFNFAIEICPIKDICHSTETPTNKQVYAKEILITTTLETYNPKKLRFFVWSKK